MRLTFSVIQEGQRVTLTDENGIEIVKFVDAATKFTAMSDPEVIQFCTDNNCRVKRVM